MHMGDHSNKSGHSPEGIQNLLRGGEDPRDGFARILRHARELSRLDGILAGLLERRLAAHCQVAEYRNRRLFIHCSQAVYATRIRMISQPLLESFREAGEFGIDYIETRVSPLNRPRTEVRQRRRLPAAAIQALGRFAQDSGDEKIQAAYDRIIARRKAE